MQRIVGIRDIRIRRTTNYRSGPRRGSGIRSAISSFSTESKRRLMFVVRDYLGGHIIRVHDVAQVKKALTVADAIREGRFIS